jgi:hypothetical protein
VRRLTAPALAVVVAVLAACGAGVLGGLLGLFKLYGEAHLGEIPNLMLVAGLVVGGHAASLVWALQARVGWVATVLTQAPFLVTYALIPFWYNGDRFPLWYFVWTAAALSAVAWLVTWYLRDTRSGRRALIFLGVLTVLVAGNGAAVFGLTWHNTNGFGLRGGDSPWGTIGTLTASTCRSEFQTYFYAGKLRRANCPSGPAYRAVGDQHDNALFDSMLSSDQPRAAFERWWDRSKKYGVVLYFKYTVAGATVDGKPVEEQQHVGGGTVVVKLTCELTLNISDDAPDDAPLNVKYPMAVDKSQEDWTVTLHTVLAGGWKVSRIDVPDPVHDSRRQ